MDIVGFARRAFYRTDHPCDDVSASLAAQTIESVRIRGVFRASPEVKEALAARIQ